MRVTDFVRKLGLLVVVDALLTDSVHVLVLLVSRLTVLLLVSVAPESVLLAVLLARVNEGLRVFFVRVLEGRLRVDDPVTESETVLVSVEVEVADADAYFPLAVLDATERLRLGPEADKALVRLALKLGDIAVLVAVELAWKVRDDVAEL